MTTFTGVPAHMLTDAWPVVEPLIVKACAGSNGRFQPGDIAKAIATKDFQLWTVLDDGKATMAALTRLVKFPRLVACELMACVGEGRENWLDNLSTIELWAKEQDAAQFHAIARPGWARVLKSKGYEHTHSLLEKTL